MISLKKISGLKLTNLLFFVNQSQQAEYTISFDSVIYFENYFSTIIYFSQIACSALYFNVFFICDIFSENEVLKVEAIEMAQKRDF